MNPRLLLWRKLFLTVKFIFIFLLLGIGNSFADSYAQSEKLSMNVHQATFDEIVSVIENQSEFVFFYKSSDVDRSVFYDVEIENKTIHEILDQLTKYLPCLHWPVPPLSLFCQ